MTRRQWIGAAAVLIASALALGYLYDPPWIGGVTSGLRPWEEGPPRGWESRDRDRSGICG